MKEKIVVIWCKWSLALGFYALHRKTFRNKEKAMKYVKKITKDKRKFIWGYEINGKEVDDLC